MSPWLQPQSLEACQHQNTALLRSWGKSRQCCRTKYVQREPAVSSSSVCSGLKICREFLKLFFFISLYFLVCVIRSQWVVGQNDKCQHKLLLVYCDCVLLEPELLTGFHTLLYDTEFIVASAVYVHSLNPPRQWNIGVILQSSTTLSLAFLGCSQRMEISTWSDFFFFLIEAR